MKEKLLLSLSAALTIFMIVGFSIKKFQKKALPVQNLTTISLLDTVKKKDTALAAIKKDDIANDSLTVEGNFSYKLYKKNAHASYYADKFTGRKTASGRIFNNNKLTAAHRKLPFGTKVRVTNERNGKSVVVEITDRGPFVKGRDIDLSRRAFMDIASNRWGGAIIVKLEIQKKK